jgi:hypothetical protein
MALSGEETAANQWVLERLDVLCQVFNLGVGEILGVAV